MPEPRRTVRSRERRQNKGTAGPARFGSAIDRERSRKQREADEIAAAVVKLLRRLEAAQRQPASRHPLITLSSTDESPGFTGSPQATDAPIHTMRRAS